MSIADSIIMVSGSCLVALLGMLCVLAAIRRFRR